MNRDFWQRFAATALGVLAGVVAAAGTLAVAVAGFTLSYDAIRSVGIASHIREDWAWLLPVSVDGAMAVATVTAVVLKRLGRSNWYPWCVVAAGAIISVLCNGLHATGDVGVTLVLKSEAQRFCVSAIPPVMLLLSVHLLVVLVESAARTLGRPAADQAGPAPAPGRDQTDPVSPPADPDQSDLFADLMPPDPWAYATTIGRPSIRVERGHLSDRQDTAVAAINGKSNGKSRRSGEEVRRQVAAIVAERGELPQKELAALLDMPERTLRYHLANGKEAV